MGKPRAATSSFRVGDRVRVPLGKDQVDASIIEDRGSIGAGGRHLFVVQVPMDPLEPFTIEVPEGELVAVDSRQTDSRRVDRKKAIDYLKRGGLVAILRSNLSGGRNQPRVWLRYDTLGNVTHTFTEERGLAGGEVVPFNAMHDEKIFKPAAKAVLVFLMSFGLSDDEANQVIGAAGTAP